MVDVQTFSSSVQRAGKNVFSSRSDSNVPLTLVPLSHSERERERRKGPRQEQECGTEGVNRLSSAGHAVLMQLPEHDTGLHGGSAPPQTNLGPSGSSDLRLQRLSRRRVGGRRGRRLDPAGPHVGEELVGDFSQDVLGESGHAQNVVPGPVDVVSERNKLGGQGWGGGEKG